MRDYIKWIIAAIVLIVVGSTMCIVSFGSTGFDVNKMSGDSPSTKEYEITDVFEDIYIEGDVDHIEFVLSEDEKCSVVCTEDENRPHNVRVENNTLTIDTEKDRKWSLSLFSEKREITVCLPDKIYGEIFVENDTGNIDLHDVISGNLSITTEMGNVSFDGCDAETINVESETGHVKGFLLSDKKFQVQSETGSIDVPKGKEGGLCSISTETGDVKIEIITDQEIKEYLHILMVYQLYNRE